MNSFEEWATKTVDHCVQQWSDRLLDLGASWDTFRRNSNDVVDDLVRGGIPLLAARDICKLASEAIARSDAPLAIFWDLENMPIPSRTSGREAAARVKSAVAPHGDLVQFRAYADIGLGLIPQQKRSDLQLSNSHLIDCPHTGRKEVADKMIIVDAMQFAFTHPEGATLCFVTRDVDYAYLLAVLQRPQWRTIVISEGTMQSMLHVNCDIKMHWESDVLQLRSSLPSTPPGFHGAPSVSGASSMLTLFVPSSESLDESQASTSHDLTHRIIHNDDTSEKLSVKALTIVEERTNDSELLRTIVREAPTYAGSLTEGHRVVLKSHVGNTLRQMNPARFPHRQAVKDLLARVVETGIVIESCQGEFKTFRLPSDEQVGAFHPVICLSESAPVAAQDMPLRALEMITILPFILFVPWALCPKTEDKFPPKTFVQSSGNWAVLMFPTLTTAQRAVAEKSWLKSGTLVDWRRTAHFKDPTPIDAHKAMEIIACILCMSLRHKSLMKTLNSDDFYCQSCWSLVETRSDSDKTEAIECIKAMLDMMAENDDIYIAENRLRKRLVLRWPSTCASCKHATLWIQNAVDAGAVIRFKRPDIKSKLICCPQHYQLAMAPFPSADIDTSAEEKHILDMLWHKNGWVKRTEASASLKENFETMKSPFLRNKCILNAAKRKTFFFAKGLWGQTLGLTIGDAQAALDIVFRPNDVEAPTTCDSHDHSWAEDEIDTAKATKAMANHAEAGKFFEGEEHDSRGSPISVESFLTEVNANHLQTDV